MDKPDDVLQRKIARLESHSDQLEAELSYLDRMLVLCGFSDGIKTLKASVVELLAEDSIEVHEHNGLI